MSETGRRRGGWGVLATVGLAGLALATRRRSSANRSAALADGAHDRLTALDGRLERMNEEAARRAEELLARQTAVEESLARSEALSTGLHRAVVGLSAEVGALRERSASVDALTTRVEHLERDTRRLDDAAERAGALAATAVAATDEVEGLVSAMRELRQDLLRLATGAEQNLDDSGSAAPHAAGGGESPAG